MNYKAEDIPIKVAVLLSIFPLIHSQSCPLDKVYNDCCGGCGYSFSDKDVIQQAISRFRENATAANELFGPMNCWDVSAVTDMSILFFDESYYFVEDTLNEPINCWDVSRAKDMFGMFATVANFNQPLDRWDVSRVNNMGYMFLGAQSFNQPLQS